MLPVSVTLKHNDHDILKLFGFHGKRNLHYKRRLCENPKVEEFSSILEFETINLVKYNAKKGMEADRQLQNFPRNYTRKSP